MKVGVVINHAEDFDTGVIPTYSELRDMAQTADSGGLDSIWLYDHLLFRFDPHKTAGIWECWTMLCALAEATNHVDLGTLVLCSPFRNPALLAKMAHTLDAVSNGRLILGVGAGWHQPEFDAFGYSFERRVDRFEEALQILKPLLNGQTVDFSGTHYQAQQCVITPLGPRPDGIPLLIGARQPRMLRITARYADQWNVVWLSQAAELAERIEAINNACADVGRDPATLEITVGALAAFADLGPTDRSIDKPVPGTADELAEAFHAYAAAGTSHIIMRVSPSSLPGIERVVEAARIYKSTGK